MDAAVPPFDILLVCAPGLESLLAAEARALGFAQGTMIEGGVAVRGGWPEIWRANLCLRGASRVLVRIGAFRVPHLAQLDRRARKFPWGQVIRPGQAVRVEASCHRSRIYHAGAAAERVARALAEDHGARVIGATTEALAPLRDEAQELAAPEALRIKIRIEDDLCTLSIDTSGESLHRRGHKQAVNKAPLRETLAAMFLRDMGHDGARVLPVLDPMCGSGTFVIEAAEIALGLLPGRSRRFAFQDLAGFDAAAYQRARAGWIQGAAQRVPMGLGFYGSDRDLGAVRMSMANAERAGLAAACRFQTAAISDISPPPGPPGLVMVNPPYGARIGNRRLLFGLYGALGEVMRSRFQGWRLGMVTSDPGLARATGLDFLPRGPLVSHGGLRIGFYRTAVLR